MSDWPGSSPDVGAYPFSEPVAEVASVVEGELVVDAELAHDTEPLVAGAGGEEGLPSSGHIELVRAPAGGGGRLARGESDAGLRGAGRSEAVRGDGAISAGSDLCAGDAVREDAKFARSDDACFDSHGGT